LGKLIVVGTSFLYAQDFGEGKVYDGPFSYIELEPKLQINISPAAYVAFAYNLRREYMREMYLHTERGIEPIKQTQWMNLRFGLYF
jgi:hypothetical protein